MTCLVFLISCSNSSNYIEDLKASDYSEFGGYSFLIRGKYNDTTVIFVNSHNQSKYTDFLILYANESSGEILKVEKHLMNDTNAVSLELVKPMIPNFLKLGVFSLGVTKGGSVLIRTINSNRPNLVRIVDSFESSHTYKDYQQSGEWLYKED